MSAITTAIPKGSLVLITGATGFVGSHTALQFLERGYKVRGTVRDLEKAAWLVDGILKTYADSGDFELAVVPDFAVEDAFDDAIKGVAAIAHIASVVSGDPDPHQVVPQTVAGATAILKAALKEPSVREFVYTSSIVAGCMPFPGNNTHVGKDTWNDTAVELAWAPPPYEAGRSMAVYMASKVAAEKAVWDFGKQERPHFTINVVSPASIFGEPLNVVHTVGLGSWMKQVYDGNVEALDRLPAFYSVDVKDVALLHVAAVLDPDVKNARIQAWGRSANWNDILPIIRKNYPNEKFIEDLSNPQRLDVTTDEEEALALLKRWEGKDNWRTLEQTTEENLKGLVELTPRA